MDIATHPFLEAINPRHSRLVHVSLPFPDWLNPFSKDGVVMRAAAIPGEVPHSKFIVARELIVGGIREGLITSQTVIVEATSGNTGQGIGQICKAIGLRANLIVPAGTAGGKLSALRVIGSGVEITLHTDPDETPVERARREGAQEGHFNPDQYANPLNPLAHKTYLAPQLFEAAGEISLLAVASGTMGTSMGLKQYATEKGLSTRVLPVVLEEEQEVPGVKPLSKILTDVRQPWRGLFSIEDGIERGTRRSSFLLCYYSWRWVPQMLGPSFGLAFQGALRRLQKAKQAGTLDELRTTRGDVQVVILGADTYLPYLDILMGDTLSDKRHSHERPDLLDLAFRDD